MDTPFDPKTAEEMRRMIDVTNFRVVKSYFANPRGEIKAIVLVQEGFDLAEVVAAMSDGAIADPTRLLSEGAIKVAVPSLDVVPPEARASAVPFAQIPDAQVCEVVYLPPCYVIRLRDEQID